MSEGFSVDWLQLREPYDQRSRDRALLERLAGWRRGRRGLRIVDLGAGTGSNLRCLAPRLGAEQDWLLPEWDRELMADGRRCLVQAKVGWRYRWLDLASDLELLADGPVDLITASALIDLVSEAWLDRLVQLRRRSGAALYVTLTYDGRVAWAPSDPLDSLVAELVNAHQRTDKGFGPALGVTAAEALALRLGDDGQLAAAASDWRLSHQEQAIQLAMLAGYEAASIAMAPDRRVELDGWAGRRRALIASGVSALHVGHQDLLLLPG